MDEDADEEDRGDSGQSRLRLPAPHLKQVDTGSHEADRWRVFS